MDLSDLPIMEIADITIECIRDFSRAHCGGFCTLSSFNSTKISKNKTIVNKEVKL